MKGIDKRHLFFIALIVISIPIFVMGLKRDIEAIRERKALAERRMKECIADGKKEYECYVLLKER